MTTLSEPQFLLNRIDNAFKSGAAAQRQIDAAALRALNDIIMLVEDINKQGELRWDHRIYIMTWLKVVKSILAATL